MVVKMLIEEKIVWFVLGGIGGFVFMKVMEWYVKKTTTDYIRRKK